MRALLTAVDGDGETLAVVVRGDGLWVSPMDSEFLSRSTSTPMAFPMLPAAGSRRTRLK